MSGPRGPAAPGAGRTALIVALVAVCVAAAGAVAVILVSAGAAAERQARRVDELSVRVAELTRIEEAVASRLAAGEATTTAAPRAPSSGSADDAPVPLTVTATEGGLGVYVSVVRLRSVGDGSRAGWPVVMQSGNYLDGAGAFSVASSNGDVFEGTYYVDPGRDDLRGRLLRRAPVVVYGWMAGKPRTRARVTARQLAARLAGTGPRAAHWRQAWFWVKVSRGGDILAASETLPQ